MKLRLRQLDCPAWMWRTLALLLLVVPAATAQPQSAPASQPSLAEREDAIRARVQYLENRLLVLNRLLTESEPDKAERLREALDQAGKRQVKRRLEQLVALMKSGHLSDADAQQQAVLADLQAVLTVLTDTSTDLDRRRAERERLEGFRRSIQALQEGQREELYRTQAATTQPAGVEESESRQRALERRTAALAEQMKPAGEGAPKTPGERQIDAARQHMQAAADQLSEQHADEAVPEQQGALEQLQRAQDALDDALRQVRREELEETLAALETRFKSMLTREHQVRQDVGGLSAKAVPDWTRTDQLKLAEVARVQHGVADDCQAVMRILVEEGTTVILPDLAQQIGSDMSAVATRLDGSDVSPATGAMLDGVIAALEEITAAIELKHKEERNTEQEPAQEGSESGNRPLLPQSAELKLLRSAQVRINNQTAELEQRAGASAASSEADKKLAQRLALRQKQIAEMTRRMNERQ